MGGAIVDIDALLRFPAAAAGRAGPTVPQVSPDGRRVAYAADGDVWSVSTTGGQTRRIAEGGVPQWSPNGHRLAFLGEEQQLWHVVGDGPAQPLARVPGGVAPSGAQATQQFAWSRAGRSVVLLAAGSSVAGSRQSMWVVDAASGGAHEATVLPEGVRCSGPAWSPDGTRVALTANVLQASGDRGTAGQRAQHVLALLDPRGGAVGYPLGWTTQQAFAPRWSPDGRRLALPFSPHEAPHFLWRPACGVLPTGSLDQVTGDAQKVAALPLPTCFATDYYVHPWGSVRWHPDGRSLFCRGSRGISAQVLRVDTATGAVAELTAETGVHDHLSPSADGRWLACTFRSPRSLPELHLLSADGRARRRLTDGAEALRPLALGETEVVGWTAPDGLALQGLLVTPGGGDRRGAAPPPVIVDVHGGPVASLLAEFHPEWHVLAARGYAVFAPDFRGSQLYGWYGAPTAPADARDVLAGVEWLAATGRFDATRVGLRAHSYGCQVAGLLLGLPAAARRFGAAVLSGTVAGNEDTFAHLRRAAAPTLILVGERDNVAMARAYERELLAAGVPVESVVYPGEGHTVASPGARRDYWRRTLAWFDRHLQPQRALSA